MLKYHNFNIVFSEIPDEVTLAINITGCPNHCEGCHSPWLQKDTGKELNKKEIDALLDEYGTSVTCCCLMGGDSDAQEVDRLARYIKSTYQEIKTAWYSGRPILSTFISLASFDYIKIGGYMSRYGPLTAKTTNQRMYKVTKSENLEDITKLFWKE
jgi:anaerobic ribonucleoside-triphosphate reductase activating protein